MGPTVEGFRRTEGYTLKDEHNLEGRQPMCLTDSVQESFAITAPLGNTSTGSTQEGSYVSASPFHPKELHNSFSSWNVAGITSNMADPEWGGAYGPI